MRAGVYVDAFDLYFGMRGICGRGSAGWRWLDVRALATALCGWTDSYVDRVVYCTARVDAGDSPGAYADQDVYLKALRDHASIDVLELGRYVAWPKRVPLANESKNGRARLIVPNGAETWVARAADLQKIQQWRGRLRPCVASSCGAHSGAGGHRQSRLQATCRCVTREKNRWPRRSLVEESDGTALLPHQLPDPVAGRWYRPTGW